jgi:hypothetical protein
VYRKRYKQAQKPRSEWVAVPIPDAGIPREWVDAARDAIKDNKRLERRPAVLGIVGRGVALPGVRLGDEPAHGLPGRQLHPLLLLLPLRKAHEGLLRRMLELPPLPRRGAGGTSLARGPRPPA